VGLSDKRPHGLLRLGFRLPIWFYRWHIGWLLGERFLLLTHTGRKSGAIRQTVIEVVGHDKATGAYYVVSGFGRKADWFLNIQKEPKVKVTVGSRLFEAEAGVVSDEDAADILLDYATGHPLAFRELSKILLGETIQPTCENCLQFVQTMPMVSFFPMKQK
jgi:deazaflavin-dependent oxidoreductase (nitroreductase family)